MINESTCECWKKRHVYNCNRVAVGPHGITVFGSWNGLSYFLSFLFDLFDKEWAVLSTHSHMYDVFST